MASRRATSGLPGRPSELGHGERFGRLGRRLGSSSTAAKRRSQTGGDMAWGLQRGWEQPRRAAAPISQGDVLAGGWGSPHDVDTAGGRLDGRHVAVDPGERLGRETRARAYGYAAGAGWSAEVKGCRSSSPAIGWNGDLGHDTFPHRGCSTRGSGSSTVPRSGARFGRCAVGRVCPEHRKADLHGNVAGSPRLRGCPRHARRGIQIRSAVQSGARRCPSHPLGLGRCLASRRDIARETRWLESGSTGRPQHPMTRRGGGERGFLTHVEGTPLELFSSKVLFSS